MYDVRPTLANMFGFSSKYALGHDIFSISDDEDNIVILPSGNFITDKVYYDSQNDAYFDLTDYKNVAIYASCNQEYKDDPLPMYTEQKEGLYKFSQSEFGVQNVEARLNNGVVDSSYIEDRVTYATERIDISNTIIYYDMIYRHGDFNEDLPEDNADTDTRTPFTPPDTVKRKEVFAV
jgi:hypothetical protein